MSAVTQCRPYKQAIALQQLIITRVLDPESISRPDLRPESLSDLVKSWDLLENRKRILRGRPDPGRQTPLPPERKRRGRGRPTAAFSTAMPSAPAAPAAPVPASDPAHA